MPLSSQAILSTLQSTRNAAPYPMQGLQFDKLAVGISTGVFAWAVSQPTNVALTGAASGALGVGAIPLGKLIVPPNPTLMISALRSAGLGGPLGVSLGSIVGVALPTVFSSSASYVGVSPGVAVGVDISKVTVSNAGSLIAILLQTIASSSGSGPALPQLAAGLGNGIAGCVAQGSGSGSVVGTPGPSSGVTVTTSVVV